MNQSTPRFHRLVVSDVRRETTEAVSIAFEVPPYLAPAFSFDPGQYLTLKAVVAGEEVRRSYSICSGVDDGELRVAVKEVESGLFSSFANKTLKAGDELDVMTPVGRFTAPIGAATGKRYLMVAAGSGITPILSIIRTVLSRELSAQVTLVYGNRNAASILFKAELDDLKDRFLGRLAIHHVLSREVSDVALAHGRIDASVIETLVRTGLEPKTMDEAFLCGPLGMVEAVRDALLAHGLPAARVHVELFFVEGTEPRRVEPAPRALAHEGLALSVRLDGRLHVLRMAPDETIVEAALRHGLDLPYSCRGGMCCTCRAKLIEGSVTMDQNFSLEPWELDAGFVLTCQSRPRQGSAALSVDFDAA